MTEAEIKKIVEAQRAWFRTGATLDVRGRLAALERLAALGQEGEREQAEAFFQALERKAGEGHEA